jgi:hypothetical protein
MMCCLVTLLVVFGPRLVLLIWYFSNPVYWNLYITNGIFACLGFIFLPWTLLCYLVVAPGGVEGLEWLLIGLGIAADIASYSGGAYGNRNRIPGYGGSSDTV